MSTMNLTKGYSGEGASKGQICLYAVATTQFSFTSDSRGTAPQLQSMEKLRKLLHFRDDARIFGRDIERTAGTTVIPPFLVDSLSSFEGFYESKGPDFLKDYPPTSPQKDKIDSVVGRIDKGEEISWHSLTADDPWMVWHVADAFLYSLPSPLIPKSALEKLSNARQVAGFKHTNLLLHRHVVESLPQAKCALLEYITSQIEHFAEAYQLSNEVTGDIFRTTGNAAFQAGDQEQVWENFQTFVNLHDKIFRAKFHPLANSLTVPPAISLAQVAASCLPVVSPCNPGVAGKANEPSDSTRSPGKRLAILALDGGGMRGLIEIKILSALATKIYGDCDENGTKKLLANFDIVAGTSTGGIIALALQKMSLSKVREFYLSMGRQIFKSSYIYGIGRWLRYYQSGDYYSGQTLTSLFKTEFGDTRLSDLFADSTSQQRLFLATTNATNAVWEPFVLRSYLNPTSIIPGAANVTTPDALRATSAAPTYFAAVELQVEKTHTSLACDQGKVQLVDGGMTANNPTELAIFEAHHLSDSPVALIVSVGTGMPGTQPGSVNVFKMLNELIDICTSSNAIHLRVLEWIEMMPDPKPTYFRFNPSNGEGSYALDECDDAVLAALEASTERYMCDPAVLEMTSALQLALQQLGT